MEDAALIRRGPYMFALNERLSEYAYGFGATSEAVALLRSTGLHVAPFLPSLIHENEVGFDVAFSGPGTMLMLQFKLGHQLSRFVRKTATQTPPPVARPFWRFEVNVEHVQFQRLKSWEILGADVHYVAPRFDDWQAYERHFLAESILENSLLMTPSDIEAGADGAPGKHRVVYDRTSRFVCSEPRRAPERSIDEIIGKIRQRTASGRPLSELVVSALRVEEETRRGSTKAQLPRDALSARLRSRARSPIEGEAAAFAAAAWTQCAQVVFISEMSPAK